MLQFFHRQNMPCYPLIDGGTNQNSTRNILLDQLERNIFFFAIIRKMQKS